MDSFFWGSHESHGRLDTVAATHYAWVSNERSTHFMPASRVEPEASSQKLETILRHAAHVFADKGYEGASIRDISRSSRISLSGLYYYVKSKQEILYLIQIHTFKNILARLQESLGGVRDPSERLRILVHNHLAYFLQHPTEMKVLAHEDDALEGCYGQEVAEIKRKYYGIAIDIFEGLRPEDQRHGLTPRIAVLSLFGMMNWIHTWHKPQSDPQAEALSRAMSEMFLHGVMNGNQSLERGALRDGEGHTNIAARLAV
jgi:TetR/AcrR family transcriptional regulator, cholesterol catabolism regulator